MLLPLGLAAVGFSTLPRDAKATSAPAKPTYAEHIAPILNKNCVNCHRPNAVAPFSLIGYDNAKKWAGMVAQVTHSRQMPPWKAVQGFGSFKDERRLSDAEIETLQRWQAQGAPEGDKKKVPKTPVFSSEFEFGTPDMVLSAKQPFKLDAEGDDVYRNFVLPTNFDQDTWVKAISVKAGNPKVVHHVIAYLDNNGVADKLEAKTHDGQEGYSTFGGVGFAPSGVIGVWAPGLNQFWCPTGTAFKIRQGARIVLQVHYHKSGKAEQDQTKLAIYTAKEPIEREMILAWNFNFNVNIPAGEANHKMTLTSTIRQDRTVYNAMPHMHMLGRTMKAWFEMPDGKTQPLVAVQDWDFNWQMSYELQKPLKIPAGANLQIEATYDNSSDNPKNPNNPPKRVTWGEQTTDEMFLLLYAYTVDGPSPKPAAPKR